MIRSFVIALIIVLPFSTQAQEGTIKVAKPVNFVGVWNVSTSGGEKTAARWIFLENLDWFQISTNLEYSADGDSLKTLIGKENATYFGVWTLVKDSLNIYHHENTSFQFNKAWKYTVKKEGDKIVLRAISSAESDTRTIQVTLTRDNTLSKFITESGE